MLFFIFIYLCVFIQITITEEDHSQPIVRTKNGAYQGLNHTNYYSFEGIRYAQPPVGILRFRPPMSYERIHKNPIGATRPGPKCIQYLNGEVLGEEDCLFLNIYTPCLGNECEKLPVIFYIHGGGFIYGAGVDYGPGHIVSRRLVYVNINYRLGPMGFLAAGDREIAGNMGLKDQVMALKYIKENIAEFGGDPNNVIIVGWSAGGASVQFHYLSNMSKGLFSRGISHSGSAFNPWVWQSSPDTKFERVCRLVGCVEGDLSQKINCLKNVPAKNIVETVKEFQPFRGNPFNPFGVVLEKVGNCKTKFMPETPQNLIDKKKVQSLPWITTHVKDEGYYPIAQLLAQNDSLSQINESFDELMPLILHFPVSSYGKTKDITQLIRNRYMGKVPINDCTLDSFLKIVTDYLYVVGIQNSMQLQGALMPVYSYKFNFKTVYSFGEFLSNRQHLNGVAHGEDITLIYETRLRANRPFTSEEKAVMDLLLDMYETFAYSGLPSLGALQMSPTTSKDRISFTLITNATDLKQISNADPNSISDKQFWDDIQQKLIMASSSISQLLQPKMTKLIPILSVLIFAFS